MYKRFSIFNILILMSISLWAQSGKYHLNGTIPSCFDGQKIMLFIFKAENLNEIFRMDSTIAKDGKFYFEGKETIDNISIITCGNYPDKQIVHSNVILEAGNIHLLMDSVSKVGGTPLNDSYQHYCNEIQKQSESEVCHYIKVNLGNAIGKTLFMKWRNSIGDVDTFRDLMETADSTLKNNSLLAEAYQDRIRINEAQKLREQLSGQPYKDCTLLTINNQKKQLADYIGKSKYLLIDMWASWCGPCLRMLPGLKKINEKYKDRGLQIIGVSLDTSPDIWKKAYTKHELPWEQLRATDGLNSDICQQYFVKGIPNIILIGQDGKIILTGPMDDLYLEQIFRQILP